jgi:DNA polymerase-1
MSGLTTFLMKEVELPLIRVVADMEDHGYPIDAEFFKDLAARLEPEKVRLARSIRKTAGKNFNPDSKPQLRKLLFKKLGLKVNRRTKTGLASTDESALKRLAPKHPVIGEILRWRTLSKVITTYCTIPETVGTDGRLHVEFNQLAARTGRFSSSSVIQTLPKNDEFNLRRGFRASEGHLLVGADFDQQELRVLAQCSGDKKMRAAIAAGVDLHGLAAVKVFKLNCAPNEVKMKFKAERDRVKAIQFGLVYGKSPYSLSQTLNISIKEAKELVNQYFRQFPKVKRFIDGVHKHLLRDHYIDDIFGRRRYFPDAALQLPRRKSWQNMNEAARNATSKIAEAKRQAQNFAIQGPSATITKLAMINCHRHITAEHSEIKMLLTLHDELHFEVPHHLVDHFAKELPDLMCSLGLERFGFKVPMKVEIKFGPSWGELKTWEGIHDGRNGATA